MDARDPDDTPRLPAILLADQTRGPLDGLGGELPPALLPVLDKPLAVWAAEELAMAGVTELVVAVADGASRIEEELGDGARFGIAIRYQPTRGDAKPDEVRRRSGSDARLAASATVLRHGVVEALLRRDGDGPRTVRVDGHDAGVWRLGEGQSGLLELSGPLCQPTADLPGYHAAHLAAAAGGLGDRPTPGHPLRDGLRVRDHVTLHPNATLEGPAFLGRHCRVEADARLAEGVVLGGHVVVGEGAELRRAVVLPGTWIGPHLTVEDAIVSGSTLLRLDLSDPVQIDDPTLLAPLDGPLVSVGRPLKRFLAALAFLLSLPLWPLALLDAQRCAPGQPSLRRRRVVGARAELQLGPPPIHTVWETRSSVPVLRHLPGLLAVLAGRLELVGIRPRVMGGDGLDEGFEAAADRAPPGLLGPALVDAPADGTEEDRLMAEALYAGTRSLPQDLSILRRALGALFGPRAWKRRAAERVASRHAGAPVGV